MSRSAPPARPGLLRVLGPALLALLLGLAAAGPAAAVSPDHPTTGLPPGDPDPGAMGPQTVEEVEYDLGDQAFRPEGFGAAVEVRAKVYAPTAIVGAAPLVILQHGRHVTCGAGQRISADWPCPPDLPEIPSYRGYDALGQVLASHGALVVSIGANGVNANDGFSLDGGASARGQLILEHLRLWQQWNATAGGPFGARFVGHVDLQRVGLMGHSRGGEGVVAAAEINRGRGSPYGIAAVSALAPVDFARRVLNGVPLQVILPFCDGDVSDLQGASYYDDSRFAVPGDLTPKQTSLLYGANHNFFNTVWTAGPGSFDDADFFGPVAPPPAERDHCAPGGPGRLAAPVQSAAGATLMSGFLRRYLFDDATLAPFVTGVAPFPASSGGARWSVAFHGGPRLEVARWDDGEDTRVNRQGGITTVRAFSSALACQVGSPGFFFLLVDGPGTDGAPCPGQPSIQSPNDAGALDLGWTRPTGVVRAALPAADVTAYDGLRFRIAFPPDSRNERRGRQDLSVRLTDTAGGTATVAIGPRTNAVARRPVSFVVHSVLNGVRLPLSAFAGVDLTQVASVELLSDRTGSGRALVDDLAFTAEGTGDRVGPTAGPDTPAPVVGECRRGAARRWACATAAVLWGREPSEGQELGGIAGVHGSPAARRARIGELVAGSSAAIPVVGRVAQQLFGTGELAAYFAGGSTLGGPPPPTGRWDDAITVLAVQMPFSSADLVESTAVVDALFTTLVGRLPSSSARAYWVGQIELGRTYLVARSLLGSAERAGRVVDDRYRQILGRAPDPAGRAYWVAVVRRSGGEQRMVASLLASAEHVAVSNR